MYIEKILDPLIDRIRLISKGLLINPFTKCLLSLSGPEARRGRIISWYFLHTKRNVSNVKFVWKKVNRIVDGFMSNLSLV